jgi:hypothetical protein
MGIHNNSTLMRGTLWDGFLASKAELPLMGGSVFDL